MSSVSDYDVVICVAGSRGFNDYREFCFWVDSYLDYLKADNFCFVSGAASKGPDDMIIRYAKEHNFVCFEYPADWDELGKAAGMIRNAEMREVITHLLAFWDGVSRGTAEMIDGCHIRGGIEVATIIVTPDNAKYGNQFFSRKKHYGSKSKGSGAKYPRRY